MWPEVDDELEARVARLRKILDREDASDAHLDLLEVFDGRHVRIIGRVSDVFHRATDWEIVAPTRVLRVTWDDGNVSEYAWEPLRRACMCAYCHGEGAYQGEVNDDTRFTEEQTTLKEVFPVGRYGLTPSWGDGHDTGIYTFKMLRRASGLE